MEPLISLILPIYNEEKSIRELYERSVATLKPLGTYEIIFVNDGSSDDSIRELMKTSARDHNVKIIDFSRNFGHQIAITAGLDYARGSAVVIMDSDLQDTPETIKPMVEKWKQGYEIVYAKRRSRRDGPLKKATAWFFYRLLRKFANIEIPKDTGDFRLMDKRVASEMRRLREHSRFMRGLTSWVGFKQTEVLFDRDSRKHGQTAYSVGRMLKFAFDGLTSFSYIPLKLASLLGFITALLSLGGIAYALFRKFFYPGEVISGWTFSVIAIFLIGSVQLIVLGVIGEYIGRIYTESQARPLYVIRNKVNINEKA